MMKQDSCLFSIVIPTYNRPDRLANCLATIAQLDYPPNQFEVIVVDDGSYSPLEPVISALRSHLNLTLIRQSNAGPATARNTGANQAIGKFLVFTDDDCTLPTNYLQVLEKRFSVSPHCMIGGRTINSLPDNLFSSASQILIDYLYDYYNCDAEKSTFFASNNFTMSTELFRQLKGFNTDFPLAAGEDREFCDRWLQSNYPMVYVPELCIYHAHDLTLGKFWRQHFNYGRGAFYFHKIRGQRTRDSSATQERDRIKVEPLSFYFQLLTYPLLKSAKRGLILAILMGLSQAANMLGFFWERSNYRKAIQ
jgi:GT2 family glycosyltransferase